MFEWIMEKIGGYGVSMALSRLFWIRPRIRKQGLLLEACSDWRSQVLSLGFGSRRVMIIYQQSVIRIFTRRFWLIFRVRRIPFDRISAILYGYADMSPGALMPWGAYQQNDLFWVGLRLHNGEELTLFRFFGEGDLVNQGPFPDWLYWEDKIMVELTRGPQESESRMFAELLSKLIGAPIENP